MGESRGTLHAEELARRLAEAETRLRALERERQTLLEKNARFCAFVKLTQECFFEVNHTSDLVELFGEGSECSKYDSCMPLSCVPEENRRTFLDVFCKSPARVESEFLLCDEKGERRWYRIVAQGTLLPDGTPERVIGYFRDIQAQKRVEYSRAEYERRLRQRSVSDAITGLLNRGTTEEVVNVRLAAAAGKNICILADVDDFKLVNDTHGHVFGDMVLREISEVFRSSCRSNDVAGRIGGDEFFIMLCNVPDVFDARARLERIIQRVAELTDQLAVQHAVSVSIGAVVAKPDDHDFADVYARADKALYHAKRDGKNTFCLCE